MLAINLQSWLTETPSSLKSLEIVLEVSLSLILSRPTSKWLLNFQLSLQSFIQKCVNKFERQSSQGYALHPAHSITTIQCLRMPSSVQVITVLLVQLLRASTLPRLNLNVDGWLALWTESSAADWMSINCCGSLRLLVHVVCNVELWVHGQLCDQDRVVVRLAFLCVIVEIQYHLFNDHYRKPDWAEAFIACYEGHNLHPWYVRLLYLNLDVQ